MPGIDHSLGSRKSRCSRGKGSATVVAKSPVSVEVHEHMYFTEHSTDIHNIQSNAGNQVVDV